LQLLADRNLASQFVKEIFKGDHVAVRLPMQHSLKNPASPAFSWLETHAAQQICEAMSSS